MLGIKPFPDESLIGFIYRLADRQRRVSGRTFALKLGMIHPVNWPSEEVLTALSEASGLPISELKPLTFGPLDKRRSHFRGRFLPFAVFKLTYRPRRMVCPLCLVESNYHRAIWDLVFISACPVHKVRLEGFCPDCGRDLRWWAYGVDRCRCGKGDMCRVRPQPIDNADIIGTEAVQGLLGDHRFESVASDMRALLPFRDLADGEIVDFLWRIGLERLGSRPNILSVEHPKELVIDAHLALKEGVIVARRWPDSFFDLLDGLTTKWPKHKVVSSATKWSGNFESGHGLEIESAIEKWRKSAIVGGGPDNDGQLPRKSG